MSFISLFLRVVRSLPGLGELNKVGGGRMGNDTEDFSWSGPMPNGGCLEIVGVNGSLQVQGSAGKSEVQIRAIKRGRAADIRRIDVEVIDHGDKISVRPLYPSDLLNGSNSAAVHFAVEVPSRIHFLGKVTNGNIEVKSVSGDVKTSTVNGRTHISSAGFVQADSVNGSIWASLHEAEWTRPLEFHTLNGSIRVELPERVHTSVSAQTQNGRVSSDFVFAQESKRSRTSLHGLIGPDEGRKIICESFNGNVHLARNS